MPVSVTACDFFQGKVDDPAKRACKTEHCFLPDRMERQTSVQVF